MKTRPLWPFLLPAAVLGLITALFIASEWLGAKGIQCGFLDLTGLHCPGCGGTRCAAALANGNIIQALSLNALLTLGAITFTLGSLYLIIRVTLLKKSPPGLNDIHPRWIWAGVAGIILFTVLRNTETFSWLAP